jgi:hypothetical protein
MNSRPTPAVWKWYVAYCVMMAVMYLLLAGIGICLLVIDPSILEMEPTLAKIQGVIFGIMGAALLLPFAVAPFLPNRPWTWIYGMVLICVGLTGCCFWPASIPLLIFWLKPDCRTFFGKPS